MRRTDYRVNEIFYSLQGEGYHTGTAAVFVRFAGCNLRCAFCDTHFDEYTVMTREQIVAEVSKHSCGVVVLTGGEPSLQVDEALVEALHGADKRVHVETNGTGLLPESIDWVTCSPKRGGETVVKHIDELKVVYEGQDLGAYDRYDCANRFLQPCSNRNVAETVAAVKEHPSWRLSLQTHIIIGIR